MGYTDQGYITVDARTKKILDRYRKNNTWKDFLSSLLRKALKHDRSVRRNQ